MVDRSKKVLRGESQRGAKRTARVPIRFEKLLVRAAGDAAFRAQLLRDRAAAVDRLGLTLTPTEQAMLRTLPDQRLEAMVDAIDLKRHTKRKFGRAVAAAAFAAAAATSALAPGCDAQSDGITGDWPDVDVTSEPQDVRVLGDLGAMPDIPDVGYSADIKGLRADIPEARDDIEVPDVQGTYIDVGILPDEGDEEW